MQKLIEAAEVWVALCMKDYHDSRTVPDELVQLCVQLKDARKDDIPVPCAECAQLQEVLHYETEVAAMFQTVLEEIVEEEADHHAQVELDGGDNPDQSFACKFASDALSAYAVKQEQFSKQRSLPLPDREDDDIPF